jgi:serine/threonine protein kinase/tetratricopeptide (TPR) repeat protein
VTDEERADEIVGRSRRRLDGGEALDVEAVVRAHPGLDALLRERFAALARLDRAFLRPAATTSLVGRALGRYRLVSELGSGGMGTVYLAAVPDKSGASVAVKVVHPHLAARDGYVERFHREADLGRRVRHANVVATLDAGTAEVDGVAVRFLAMEYVEGRTLRALLDEMGRLPEELCRHVGREIARALAAIHEAGAVHRDLKPDNVLVTREHVVKVMDLGVARVLDDAARISQTGAFVGSLLYGAPEQMRKGAELDGRADLHALGLLLYELATGAHPFGDEFALVLRRLLGETPSRLGRVDPQLSPFLEELVAQLLEKEPERRPASAADVARILEEGEVSAWWHERSAAIRRATRHPLRRIRIPRETSLYGREADLALLRSLFDRASNGEGQVALIEGEAGIGKSRLVEEFVLSLGAGGEDIDFLFGSYPPGGAATASGAFSTAYREHLGDDEATIRDALPQTPLLVPAFAALLRGDVPPPGTEPLTKDSLQTVFVHATRFFAARRTTIVLIDDLHFAPEEGRALFASLALAVPGHRILLVGGARPVLDEKWVAGVARLPHLTRLRLPRLGAKDLVRLLHDALKSQHLAEELAGKIATKSDGNPFFVFEILRGLREGQFLTRKPDGTWVTTKEIRDIQVPSSIVDVVQARVSDLDRGDRNVLEVAACIGFEFDAALVGDVLGVARIPLLQRLGAIEKRHRLVRSVGHRFAFDHHQVQEVLYAGLSAPLREAYHAGIADAIEARSGAASKEPKDLDGALCVELAEHLLNGAQGPRALRYLDVALTRLEKSYLNDAAVRFADRALSAPGLVAGRARVELLLRMAKRLDLVGRRSREGAVVDEARAVADAVGDPEQRARVMQSAGWLAWRSSRYEEAEAALKTSLTLSRAAANASVAGAAHRTLGIVYWSLGRYDEAQVQSERQLELAQEQNDKWSESAARTNLGLVLNALGRGDAARANHECALGLAVEIGDRSVQARAMGNLGISLLALGRAEEALAASEQTLALAREIGDRRTETGVMGSLATVLLSLGRLAESAVASERQVGLAREIGDRRQEASAFGNLGSASCALGRIAEAQKQFECSLVLAREIGALEFEGHAIESLAEVAAESDDFSLAERRLTESIGVWHSTGARGEEAQSFLARGALLVRLGRVDEARSDFDSALATARELAMPGVEVAARAHLALLRGDADDALAVLAEHGDRVEVRMLMQARRLLWLATRDVAHLVEAKRLLDHLTAHAPPECRESMLSNVRLHREIAAAARQHGVA